MTEKKVIPIRCDCKDYLEIGQFLPLQGDLKEETGNLDKLEKVIIKRGWTSPIFVCKVNGENLTLDGHGRDIISTRLKDKGYRFEKPTGEKGLELPIVYVYAATRQEAKEILLEHNSHYRKITEDGLLGFINEPHFQIAFDKFKFDLDLPGFDLDNFDSVSALNPESLELDEVPEPRKEPISQLGDIFVLNGKHRIMCGDSTDPGHVEACMRGILADMVFTDPPYNVDYEGKTKEKLKIANDKKDDGEFRGFLVLAFSNLANFTKKGGGNIRATR